MFDTKPVFELDFWGAECKHLDMPSHLLPVDKLRSLQLQDQFSGFNSTEIPSMMVNFKRLRTVDVLFSFFFFCVCDVFFLCVCNGCSCVLLVQPHKNLGVLFNVAKS